MVQIKYKLEKYKFLTDYYKGIDLTGYKPPGRRYDFRIKMKMLNSMSIYNDIFGINIDFANDKSLEIFDWCEKN